MREFVSQKPATLGSKEGRFQNDDMPDGNACEVPEASGGQAIEPCTCCFPADALWPAATQERGGRVSDEIGGRGPGCAKGAKYATLSSSWHRDASHAF